MTGGRDYKKAQFLQAMDMSVILTVVIAVPIPKHAQFLYINYTSIKLFKTLKVKIFATKLNFLIMISPNLALLVL